MMDRVGIVGLAAMLSLGCAAELDEGIPQEADELAAALHDAAGAGDVEAVLALAKWEGVEDPLRASLERSLRSVAEREVASVTVEDLPTDYRARRVRSGVEYRPNLEVLGLLRVRFADDGATAEMSLPYGRDAEGLRIPGTVQSEVVASGESNDVSISIAVLGGGSGGPVGFSGSCTVMRIGEEVEESFSGAGNLTTAVWGTAVRRCEVRRTTAEGWLEMRISVGGDPIFESGRVDGGEPLVFVE